MSNRLGKSLYADEDGQVSVRNDIKIGEAGEDELLVETLYSGVNPADIKHSTLLGIRSTVIGYDICGRVLSVPANSKFRRGDVVAGYTPSGLGRSTKYGTHQANTVCPESMMFKVPPNLPHTHAAALAVVAMTAADVVFNHFKLPLPTPTPNAISEPILIWGASSSVGICAIQFARASGCRNIFVTASPSRHELLKSLGATHCFDYSKSTVTSDIVAAVERLGQGPIVHAIDAVGSYSEPSSAELTARCVPSPRTPLLSVVLQQDKRFSIPFAMPKDDWVIHPLSAPAPITIPGRPGDHWKAWEAMQWAIENYGSEFKLPQVDVCEGTAEEALAEVHKVANSGRGFGKLVIRHPLE